MAELEHIRDFIVLHYHVTDRQDTPFWNACRTMEIPASLHHRIELFRETGRVFRFQNELFAENSWIQVMLGQGITAEAVSSGRGLDGRCGAVALPGWNQVKRRQHRTAAAEASGVRRAILQGDGQLLASAPS